ncbi:MAG: hypothetical protein JRF72_03930 [Deltaproteobacteria bacterium]|jgi:hypothetical protein|nr:hypothetical protein [Deltaproteobacteria bacterium]
MKKSIAFNLKPTGNEIAKVGEKGKRFLKSHGLSDDSVQKQIMVVRELIKSGITFENQKHAVNEMSVHIYIEENTVTTEIRKPVNESTHNHQLEALDKTIQWIRGHQDPFTPFMIEAWQTSESSGNNGFNSFGLAKIAYKTGAILDFYVSEDNILNLSAVSHVNGDH